MTITMVQILEGVATTLGTANGIVASVTLGDMTEGVNDYPQARIYPVGGESVTPSDRASFGGGIRQARVDLACDVYVTPRSSIGADSRACMDIMDGLYAVLDGMQTGDLFGLPAIDAYRWEWRFVTIELGQQQFMGLTLNFEIFIY